MESEDELSHSKRHDADSGRHRFLWRHGWKFLRARLSKRPQVVGAKSRRRDWWRRHYLFGQWDTKDRRCKRSHRNSVANRNHNRQGINTWIGVRGRRPPHRAMTVTDHVGAVSCRDRLQGNILRGSSFTVRLPTRASAKNLIRILT